MKNHQVKQSRLRESECTAVGEKESAINSTPKTNAIKKEEESSQIVKNVNDLISIRFLGSESVKQIFAAHRNALTDHKRSTVIHHPVLGALYNFNDRSPAGMQDSTDSGYE